MKTTTAPVIEETAAKQFLTGRRFALIGASDDHKSFSMALNSEMTDRGYEIVPVNPTSTEMWGRTCYPTVADVAGDIDGAIVMVPAKASADVVRQCIDAGVRNIWLFKGVGGPGSTSAEATALCRDADVEVIDGACPLMFLDHAGWVHRFHHAVRSARGAIVNCRDLS